MRNDFSKGLLTLALVFTGILLQANAPKNGYPTFQSNQSIVSPTLTVTQMTPTSANMSWTAFGNASPYTVTVTDLTTSKQVTSFGTYNTRRLLAGLLEATHTALRWKKQVL